MTTENAALVTVAYLPKTPVRVTPAAGKHTRTQRDVEMTSDACIAFTGGGVQKHDCLIVDGNVVKVWDPIAGYYTSCHRMPAWCQGRMILAVTYGV